jgi:hypothetical protein
VPAIVTAPVASQTTDLSLSLPAVKTTVTPVPILIVVKLKMLSPAGSRPRATGSKIIVPGVVKFSAPSLPVDPLLNCADAIAALNAISVSALQN